MYSGCGCRRVRGSTWGIKNGTLPVYHPLLYNYRRALDINHAAHQAKNAHDWVSFMTTKPKSRARVNVQSARVL